MTHSITTAAAALLVLTLATPVIAQEDGPRDSWSLGLVAAIATNPYLGEDTEVLPYPALTYRNGPFSIGTFGVEYDVYATERLTFSAGLVPRFTGLFSTDAPELDGIDRKVTGDVALGLEYDLGNGFSTDLTFRQEFTGEHDGQELVLDLGYGTQIGWVGLKFSAGAAWQSRDLSGFIWGVSPSEARPGRPAYSPGDVIIPYAAVNAFVPLTQNWTLIGTARADFLPSDVSDSPIVDEDDIYSLILGATYSF
ncbi:MAG: MipA/OmpV family protein [Pseudomonadota bacterium]